MVIPADLQNLVRMLAFQRHIETHNAFQLLSQHYAPDHPDVIKAKQLFDEARDLSLIVGEPVKAAA